MKERSIAPLFKHKQTGEILRSGTTYLQERQDSSGREMIYLVQPDGEPNWFYKEELIRVEQE
jgi:hypothetical protein